MYCLCSINSILKMNFLEDVVNHVKGTLPATKKLANARRKEAQTCNV